MFEAYFSNTALKSIRKSESALKERVHALVAVLKLKPIPAEDYDLSKVFGTDSTYRVRLSSHRVVYSVNWAEKEINILKIERKSDTTYK